MHTGNEATSYPTYNLLLVHGCAFPEKASHFPFFFGMPTHVPSLAGKTCNLRTYLDQEIEVCCPPKNFKKKSGKEGDDIVFRCHNYVRRELLHSMILVVWDVDVHRAHLLRCETCILRERSET